MTILLAGYFSFLSLLLANNLSCSERLKLAAGKRFSGLEIKTGRFGGKMLLIKDSERPDELLAFPPEGRVFFWEAFPQEIHTFFGFSYDAETKNFLVPLGDEYNKAVAAVNSFLGSKDLNYLPITFYEITSSTSDRAYLYRFAWKLQQPVARRGRYLFHDINYHYLVNFAPNEPILLAQKQAKAFFMFEAWARKTRNWTPDISRIFKIVAHKLAYNLDLGTGNLGVTLRPFSFEFSAFPYENWNNINLNSSNKLMATMVQLATLCNYGLSPRIVLSQLFGELQLKTLLDDFLGKTDATFLDDTLNWFPLETGSGVTHPRPKFNKWDVDLVKEKTKSKIRQVSEAIDYLRGAPSFD